MVIFDEVVHTDYGQLDLVWGDEGAFDGDFDRVFAGQVNGLVGAAHGTGVYVGLARRSGGSSVAIHVLDAEPELDPSYQDIVEVSVLVPDGADASWESWAGESGGDLAVPPGSHRLRVNARGRDAGSSGEFADDVVDSYLLQLWPAPPSPDAVLAVGSENAAYWHRQCGTRR